MLIKCTKGDSERILRYIGSDYRRCLYLYLDFLRYGTESGVAEVYFQYAEEPGDGEEFRDPDIRAVLLIYFSCVHIYSRENDFDGAEVLRFARERNMVLFYCASDTADRILGPSGGGPGDASIDSGASPGLGVTVVRGWTGEIRETDRAAQIAAVPAGRGDFPEIAAMILEDVDISRSYRTHELILQLEQRSREGFSRNLVVKDEKGIVAHASTNAESERVAVIGELMVREDCRGRGYASEMWRILCGQLLAEGKEVFSFYFSEASRSLHRKIGFKEICPWTKILLGNN